MTAPKCSVCDDTGHDPRGDGSPCPSCGRWRAERDALQARFGDLEDSLGRALAEANQLAAHVEELEKAIEGYKRALDRRSPVLRSDRKEDQ